MSVNFDDRDFQRKAAALLARVADVRSHATYATGLEVLRLSQREVPHDKGELQNSGHVAQDGEDAIVGYNKVYAARLHEHPEYRFQKGRKGKYLIDPIKHNIRQLLEFMGNIFKR
jgi:hypothetical protein